jgi:hypothetical protein
MPFTTSPETATAVCAERDRSDAVNATGQIACLHGESVRFMPIAGVEERVDPVAELMQTRVVVESRLHRSLDGRAPGAECLRIAEDRVHSNDDHDVAAVSLLKRR